jgi:peptidoglycan/LPS O-acetylase OafA/YrhL
MSESIKYRPEIDGLRAIAVIPVVLFHAGIDGLSGGYVGVDIFFVISGYLITSIILSEMSAEKFSLIRFYERRARRILPALFFVMISSLIVALLTMNPDQFEGFGASAVSVVTYLSNFYFWYTRDYFAPAAEELPLLHTWSLSVEEQFYMLFPLLLLLLGVKKPNRLLLALVSISAVSLGLSISIGEKFQNFNFYLLPTRSWELLVGSSLALFQFRGWRTHSVFADQFLSLAGFFLVVLSVLTFDSNTPFPGLYALIPVFGTALIIFSAKQDTLIGSILSSKTLVSIGLLSYSIYLWHQPILAFYRIYFRSDPDLVSIAILLSLIFGLSKLTLIFVERPFRSKGAINFKSFSIIAISTSILFASTGLAIYLSDGMPGRFNDDVIALAKTAERSPLRSTCHTSGANFRSPSEACTYGGKVVSWAVLGDSHGVELSYALSERLAIRDTGLVHLTFSGCGPELSYRTTVSGCRDWLDQSIQRLESDSSIHSVLVAYYHLGHQNIDKLQGVRLTEIERTSLYYQNIEALLERLVLAEKEVYILLPMPRLSRHIDGMVFPQSIFESNELLIQDKKFQIGTAHYLEESGIARNMLSNIAEKYGAHLLDPSESLCSELTCAVMKGGSLLYFDDHHMTVHAARMIVDQLVFPN